MELAEIKAMGEDLPAAADAVQMLADWQAVYTRGYSQPGAQPRVEVLWLNGIAVERGPVGSSFRGHEEAGEDAA